MSPNVTPSRSSPRGRPLAGGPGVRLIVPLALALVVVLVVLAVPLFDRDDYGAALDGDLCPPHAPADGRAVLLLDLRKPVRPDLPAELVRRVAKAVDGGTELRVITLADSALAPRTRIARLCKPYANADLVVPAAKDRPGMRDCNDLPAQLPAQVRELAARFCERRDAIASEVTRRIAPFSAPVADAYLVEAIEDTRLDLAGTDSPATLYIFSDMMQHAAWYSHLERRPDAWDAAAFADARDRNPLLEDPAPSPALAVHVFYVPRVGSTENPRVERAHKRFWTAYFDGAASLTFDDQPVLPRYPHQPLAVAQAETEPASPEADDTANAHRVLELIRTEREALEETQRQTAAATRNRAEAEQAEADRLAEIAARQEALDAAERRLAAQEAEQSQRFEERLAAIEARERALEDDAAVEDAVAVQDAVAVEDAVAVSTEQQPPEQDDDPASGTATANTPSPPESPGTAAAQGVPTDPPPATVAAVTSEPQAEPADTAGSSAPPDPEPLCPLAHAPGNAFPAYPSDRRIGDATVVLEFDVDEFGETVDDSIRVDESQSDIPRRFERFRTAALRSASSWKFVAATDDDCRMAQPTTQRIEFRYED